MTEYGAGKPGILIDIDNSRIRIYKNTLYALGKPSFLLLLVNPETRTIAMMASTATQTAHRIRWASFGNHQSCELYSVTLVHRLCNVCPAWARRGKYRLYGAHVPQSGIVYFRMDEANDIEAHISICEETAHDDTEN